MDAGTRSHSATVLRWRSSQGVDRRGRRRLRSGGLRLVDRCESIGRGVFGPGRQVQRLPAAPAQRRASGEAIKVAQIAAHSGQLAQLGDWDQEALDLAFKEKNDAGGVCGRPLELTVFDDQGDPTVGVNVTRQALDTGIVAAFATTESAVTLAVGPTVCGRQGPAFHRGPERRDHQGRQCLRLP